MKIVVGLCNPGKEYERTRHNVGRRVVENFRLAAGDVFGGWSKKFRSRISEGRIGNEKIVLMLPETYMNSSGEAVAEAAAFWKVSPKDILVVGDDLSIPLGMIRLRASGTSGGHKGLDSIINKLGTEGVPRLRVGIATEKTILVPAEVFVLEKFSKEEDRSLEPVLDRAAQAIEIWISEGSEAAMNRFNG
jgi:PTH1 family peptidyl-tRNA hydrolase